MSFVNRTIDDENGDEVTGAKVSRLRRAIVKTSHWGNFQVTYYPTQLWAQGNGCDRCSSRPDSGQTIDREFEFLSMWWFPLNL